MSKIRNLNICISDIPKDAFYKSEKTGKIYLNVTTFDYDTTDTYGNDFNIALPRTKEQRVNKAPITFIGAGKIVQPSNTPTQEELNNLIP